MLWKLILLRLKALFSSMLRRTNGKKNNKGTAILYGLLFLYAFGAIGFSVYMMVGIMAEPMAMAGLGWFYFGLVGMMSFLTTTILSVFAVKSQVYDAKDNELLLSMPIPPRMIVISRLLGLLAMNLLYALLIMLPASIAWFMSGQAVTLGGLASLLCGILLIPVLSLAVSCFFAWLFSLAMRRVKRQSLVMTALAVLFLIGYMLVVPQAYEAIMQLLAQMHDIAASFKANAWPVYAFGMGVLGDWGSLLALWAVAIAAGIVVVTLLSMALVGNLQAGKAAARPGKKRGEKRQVQPVTFTGRSVRRALLRREWQKMLDQSAYLVNCALGAVLMVLLGIVALVKGNEVVPLLAQLPVRDLPLLAAAGITLFLSSMNLITAPSVSLEGRNLWILKSLPVHPREFLYAKVKLHLLLTSVPALVLSVCLIIMLKLDMAAALLLVAVTQSFILFMAELGLTLNLRLPRLDYTDATAVVKQSMSVTLTMLCGMAVTMTAILPYVLWLMESMALTVYFALIALALLAADVLLAFSLLRGGVRRWEAL